MSDVIHANEINEDEIIDAIYMHAAEMMAEGKSEDEIRASLMAQGLDTESAAAVVANLANMRSEQGKSVGKKNMLFGALWAIGGTVVTAATYSAAANGGSYVVAYGAIVIGAIQFLQGAFQTLFSK